MNPNSLKTPIASDTGATTYESSNHRKSPTTQRNAVDALFDGPLQRESNGLHA